MDPGKAEGLLRGRGSRVGGVLQEEGRGHHPVQPTAGGWRECSRARSLRNRSLQVAVSTWRRS